MSTCTTTTTIAAEFTVQQGSAVDLQVVVRPPLGYQSFNHADASAKWRYRLLNDAGAASEIVLVAGDLIDQNVCLWRIPLTALDTAAAGVFEFELVVEWSTGTPAVYVSPLASIQITVVAALP